MSQDDETAAEQTMIASAMAMVAPKIEIGHFLTFEQNGEQVRVRINTDGAIIGRSVPSDIVIAHPQISRRHCRIDLHGDWAVITDIGSTNGTFLDGQKLDRPFRIRSGSRLSLGSFVLAYERRELSEIAREVEQDADLRRAEAYVRAILPAPVQDGPVQAEWCFTPSAKLGGDAFGYNFLGDDVFTGFLLDVTGHGIGSAMHAVNVANALRRHGLPGVDLADPAQVAAGLNSMFPMEEHNGLMLTAWCFSYHIPSRLLRFCAAGHHPAFLVSPQTPVPEPLWARGPAIGMLPFGKWTAAEATMPSGAVLTVFSDGAFEILTMEGTQWTLDEFRALLTGKGTPGPLALYQAVRAAARPGPLDDDVSILQLRFP